jgi:ribonuclease HI
MACQSQTSLVPTSPPFLPSGCDRVQLSPAALPFRPSPSVRTVLVRWTPPPPGWFKLNFDGSVYNDGSSRSSIGGVIRDSTGRIIVSFAEKTEHSTVGIVEARALRRGLQLARELGLDRILAEGDDLVLVQLLRGEEMQTRIPVAMQEEIVSLLRSFRGSDVRHVYREGNSVAHTLCRQAYEFAGVWAGAFVPSAVWEKIEDDQRGVTHQRTVVRA